MGGAAAALEAYRNSATPNVIVVEAPADREALIAHLDELAHCCDSGTKVVVLGRTNDVSLYRQLMARGVSEYLVPPFDVVDFVEAISQLFRAPGAKPLGRIVSVIGSKGGVGASTVAHNLAWSLASIADKATIIADFDLAFGTAGLDYNQDPAQGVADAVFAPERVDAMLVDRLLARCGDHLSLLAAPATLDRALDFSELGLRHADRRDARLDALDRRRPAAPVERLGPPHTDRLRRCDRRRRARPRQPAQRQESDRPAQGRPAARPPAASGAQRRRHAAAARNRGGGVRQDGGSQAGRHYSRTTPNCSAPPPTTAR